MKRIFLMMMVLMLCNASAQTSALKTSTAKTPAEIIQEMESKGLLPVLDRSNSLKGPDLDNNGIRDDIDAYIAKQGYTPQELAAVRQMARSLQLAVTLSETTGAADGSISKQAALAVSGKSGRAIHCLVDRFSSEEKASTISSRYEAITANTQSRAQSYIKYNDALNGTSWTLPRGDTCEK